MRPIARHAGSTKGAWEGPTSAIKVVGAAGTFSYVEAGSTSTIVVPNGDGTIHLRMFGVQQSNAQIAATNATLGERPAGGGHDPVQTPNVAISGLPTPSTDTYNIAYIDSLSADPATADGAALGFQLDLSADATPLKSTAVPSMVPERFVTWTRAAVSSVYKDPHVLQLKDGAGWLMLLARYEAAGTDFGPGEANPDNSNAASAIVGYWSATSDFATVVRGPWFFVSRLQHVDGDDRTLWLGVPSACQLEVEGDRWLYIYFVGEDSRYLPAAPVPDPATVNGVYARRIRDSDLPWNQPGATPASPRRDSSVLLDWEAPSPKDTQFDRSAHSVASPSADWIDVTIFGPSTDEQTWRQDGDGLISGEDLGCVRIWVVGPIPWGAGRDPDDYGCKLIQDAYQTFKPADPTPVADEERMWLFFSGMEASEASSDEATAPYAWGLWRATVGPKTASRVVGMDFAVRRADDTLEASADMVVRSDADDAGDDAGDAKWDDKSRLYADPDPVALPSGAWVLFAGSGDARADATSIYACSRFDLAADVNGKPSFADAFGLGGGAPWWF